MEKTQDEIEEATENARLAWLRSANANNRLKDYEDPAERKRVVSEVYTHLHEAREFEKKVKELNDKKNGKPNNNNNNNNNNNDGDGNGGGGTAGPSGPSGGSNSGPSNSGSSGSPSLFETGIEIITDLF